MFVGLRHFIQTGSGNLSLLSVVKTYFPVPITILKTSSGSNTCIILLMITFLAIGIGETYGKR